MRGEGRGKSIHTEFHCVCISTNGIKCCTESIETGEEGGGGRELLREQIPQRGRSYAHKGTTITHTPRYPRRGGGGPEEPLTSTLKIGLG